MDIKEIAPLKAVVKFNKHVEDAESYAEPGMMARIVGVSFDSYFGKDRIWKITFDFDEFSDYNQAHESSNYFDKAGVPCLTAREAGCYTPVDTLYYSSDAPVFFELVETSRLFERFTNREDKSLGYVQWLEKLVEELEAQLPV